MNGPTARELRAMLQARAGELARQLAPGGQERHGVYEAPNPTRADRKAGSFKIQTRGPKAGSWTDYAGVNAPFAAGGDRGDVIDLIAYVKCGRDRKQALAWARDWLGLGRLSDAEKRRLTEQAQAIRQRVDQREKDDEERRRRRAFELFMAARPGLIGTLAERYASARGCDLAAIEHLDVSNMRFNPALEWWRGAHVDGRGVRMPGERFPAIVCGIRNRLGEVTGVHCTFLAPDGRGKAKVEAAKLMYGHVQGGVIRVSHGPSGMTPEQWTDAEADGRAPPAAPLILCEGLEDAWTLAEAVPEARVWAATSLGNLGHAPVDLPCVSSVIVAGDNDWGKGQAVQQFERAVLRLETHGKPVTVMRSAVGKDFNDMARAGLTGE